MASKAPFVAYVLEQIADAGHVEVKTMFGEYAVYCDGKVVGLVCDNQFFLKPTSATAPLLSEAATGPPYPGAKPYIILDAQLDDRQLATTLVRLTAAALPAPKPKKAKTRRPPHP